MLAAARIRMPFICAYCCRNLYITECKYKQIHIFLNNNYINYFYVNVTTNNFSKMYTSILYILIYKVCPKNNRTVWIENKMHIILSLKVIIYSRQVPLDPQQRLKRSTCQCIDFLYVKYNNLLQDLGYGCLNGWLMREMFKSCGTKRAQTLFYTNFWPLVVI